MNTFLHEELLDRLPLYSERTKETLLERIGETTLQAEGVAEPPLSIVVRSRNNVAQLDGLFDDIAAQRYGSEPEIVVVDTESNDGSVGLARKRGATIVPVRQADFSYPKSLNAGFEAASHPWVFSFVDHSALLHRETLQVAARWNARPEVAAAYGTVFPNGNASRTELLAGALLLPSFIQKPAAPAQPKLGFMAANCLVARKDAWQEAGGFDEAYGAGGEDGALGEAFLAAGHTVMQDPALSVFHSHGLGPVKSAMQLAYWMRLSRPHAFSRERLARYRSELRES